LRLVDLLETARRHAHSDGRVEVLRIELEHRRERRRRLLVLARRQADGADVEVRVDVLRIELDGLLELLHRARRVLLAILDATKPEETELAIDRRIDNGALDVVARRLADELGEVELRLVVLRLLVIDEREDAVRRNVVRVDGERAAQMSDCLIVQRTVTGLLA